MRPASVAVVGVSPHSIGADALANMERFGYRGAIIPVSRTASEAGGHPCVASIDDVPLGIDVALLCVPRAAVVESVTACIRREVGAAIIFASGFAESGATGDSDQQRLAVLARESGIALLGPNCIGLTNYVDNVALGFVYRAPEHVPDGPALSIIGQSGAMVGNLRQATRARGLPVAYAISTGNEVDLTTEDLLEYVLQDGRSGPIAIFAEQIRRPPDFLRLARLARERRRPIVLLHPGRSEAARESARSHTGALAGDHAVMKTLVEAEAVVVVDTLDEFADVAAILTRFPEPSGAGVAVLTDSGAFKGLALDFCSAVELAVPALAPATLTTLEALLPPFAPASNPLDITTAGLRDTRLYATTARALLHDPGVGAFVAAIMPGTPAIGRAIGAAVLPELIAGTTPCAYAVLGAPAPVDAELSASFAAAGMPFFRSPEQALRAMKHVTAFGRSRTRVARHLTGRPVIASLPDGEALLEVHAKALLAAAGIAVPRGALAHTLAEAHAIAAGIGYPVVLKAQSAALLHKTDAGGVAIGIADAAALDAAWDDVHARIAARRPELVLDGVLVEAMAPAGIECVVGARRDPQWGAVLLCGLGGVWIETLGDVQLMPLDVTPAEAGERLGALRAGALLAGVRGAPPSDRAALVDVVLRIGAMMAATPALREIEINPLVVYPAGGGAIALDALMIGASAT
jgi:acyl-CoA synthetase (NDP forming)